MDQHTAYKELTCRTECLGRPLTAAGLLLGQDIQVTVTGGDEAHIGAVTVISPEGEVKTWFFPGHRDDTISESWARSSFCLLTHRLFPHILIV